MRTRRCCLRLPSPLVLLLLLLPPPPPSKSVTLLQSRSDTRSRGKDRSFSSIFLALFVPSQHKILPMMINGIFLSRWREKALVSF